LTEFLPQSGSEAAVCQYLSNGRFNLIQEQETESQRTKYMQMWHIRDKAKQGQNQNVTKRRRTNGINVMMLYFWLRMIFAGNF